MKHIKAVVALLFISFIQPCYSQNFQLLDPNETLKDGAQSYTLPKAGFQVELYTVKKEFKAGDLVKHDYTAPELKILAKKYGVDPEIYSRLFAATNRTQGHYTTYDVAEDSIKFTQLALPDFTKIFYTYPKKKWNANQLGALTYSGDGMITDAETNYENRTFDITVKGLAGIASVAAAVRGEAASKPDRVTIAELDDILENYSKLEQQNNFDVYKDLKATMEKHYAKVFAEYFYSVKSKATPIKFTYCPSGKIEFGKRQNSNLFELDTSNGTLYYNKDLAKEIVWAKNCKPSIAEVNKWYKIRLELLAQDFQPMEKYPSSSAAPSNSYLGYNVPAKALVSIITPEDEELGLDVYKIPQFGKLAYVSAKKMHVVFQLDPMTGELKKLSVDRKAITDDQVGNTASALASAITTAKGDDADTKLDKEVKRLDNEVKKRDLLKNLEQQ
jgi:hypothetical protein